MTSEQIRSHCADKARAFADPQHRAEAIARHYMAQYETASKLLWYTMPSLGRYLTADNAETLQRRDQLVSELYEAHLQDLGTPLYPAPPDENTPCAP